MTKTVRVRRKMKRGTHSYVDADNQLITIKGGEIWKDCPEDVADRLNPAQWDFLDPAEEEARGGKSRRTPPKPKMGLSVTECPDQEGMFDVINDKTGKRINDDPLTEDEANALVQDTKGAK